MKLVDIHTHKDYCTGNTICLKNIFPEETTKISQNANLFFSVGIHPWHIEKHTDKDLEKLKELAKQDNILLIGECGLDKNIETKIENQTLWLKKQAEISEALRKPMIIHCVGCYNEIIGFRKDLKPTQQWILHGFRGKPQLAEQVLNAGFDISFGEKFNEESVKVTPIENLFVETDESEINIENIYAALASVKGCQVSELNAGFHFINRHSVCTF